MVKATNVNGVPLVFNHEQNTMCCEAAPGKSLKKLLKSGKLSSEDKTTIAEKVITILKELHEIDISHNDLHWGNCFYCKQSNKVTLIDFGFAKMTQKEACKEALTFLAERQTIENDRPLFRCLGRYRKGPKELKIRRNLQSLTLTDFFTMGRLLQKIYKGLSE